MSMVLSSMSLVWIAVVVAVGVLVAVPSDDMRRAVLVACVVLGACYLLYAADVRHATIRDDDALAVDEAVTQYLGDGSQDLLTGGPTYQVRRAATGARAIGLHTDVQAALADVARMRGGSSPGTLQTAVAAVETFLQMYHDTLMADRDSFSARQDVPILLDARREALNALHGLEFGVSHANVAPIRLAVEVVRATCARSMRVLYNKHRTALRGVVMRPPYAGVDPLMDSHMVE